MKCLMKLRNPVARSSLLHKGGVHEKSQSSYRAIAKKRVKQAIQEWQMDKSKKSFE